jgi:Phosphoesterase family
MVGTTVVDSAFPNQPFLLDDYIKPTDKTCPAPGVFAPHGVVKDSAGALPGGCTEDLVHRYYQEQWQIHGGQQDRYVAGSDAIGLAMGVYDTKALRLRGQHDPADVPAVLAGYPGVPAASAADQQDIATAVPGSQR